MFCRIFWHFGGTWYLAWKILDTCHGHFFWFRPITLFRCHLGPVQHLPTRRLCHLTWGYLGWCSGGCCVTCVTCHTCHPSQTPLVLPFSTFFNSKLQMEHLDQIFACLESRHIMHQSTYVHTCTYHTSMQHVLMCGGQYMALSGHRITPTFVWRLQFGDIHNHNRLSSPQGQIL